MGRPNSYTEEIADKICEQLADGKSLNAICKQDGFPDHKTVRAWILDNHEGFFPKYARSKDFGIDSMVETAFETCDLEQDVQRARLKTDLVKWYVGKIAPKKYGDKMQHTGADGEGPVQFTVTRAGSKEKA